VAENGCYENRCLCVCFLREFGRQNFPNEFAACVEFQMMRKAFGGRLSAF
jgi:hypothetical protein